ncbi:MAG: isoleucine--tRNA ligase [Rhodanobacteraceae bacterium]|nr:isoleucine--tRNA ligase [Rhodanobacteraceae bacterium]
MSIDYKQTIHLPETKFAMKGDLPIREPQALAAWQASDLHGRIQRATANRPSYVLHDGPPYANGQIHIGHAVNKTLKDIVVKGKLLSGFRSPYVPGWDCHGLPIELVVEKEIGKVGVKVDARTFRAKCRDYAGKQIDSQREDFKRLGVLGYWDAPYRTMDFKFEADMLRALAKIVANGHLARGAKPVHWCFDCGSALAEAEIEYADKVSPAIDVAYDAVDVDGLAKKFGVAQTSAVIAVPIWTTTPWTLPASMAVTLNAEFDYVLVEGPARDGRRVLLVLAEALAESVLKRSGVDVVTVLGRARGADLEGFKLQHPFLSRQVPIILGEHVTADAGTGAVHTAPGHGQEDFAVGQKYGIEVVNPVGGNGVFVSGTEFVEGLHVWKANDTIIELLKSRGVLLASGKLEHSYPHCWRHKTPVAFRATPQWFIAMDQAGLRAQALAAIKQVQWLPDWGQERITGMIANRPDWCISRQRTWGVPIALFIDKETQEPHPDSVALLARVAEIVEREGADAWYELDASTLLGADAAKYDKVTDILDVWFDSGVTHAGVLDARPELNGARVGTMYLEGSDQHRGWFHSSLLTSVAMHGHAPYTTVLTHGFTVDAQGRKMSKSLGNIVVPQKVIDQMGADVLRLWVASTDYRNEMTCGDEILKRVGDSYRRIRNTARFLLGNLHGFDPARDRVPAGEMLLLDRWAMQQAKRVLELAQRVYGPDARDVANVSRDLCEFATLVQELMRFCTIDMGAAYLDMTKDRLYTMQETARARRSAQTAMHAALEVLVRALAPISSFTAEEIWTLMPGRTHDSVFFATFADIEPLFDGLAVSAEESALLNDLTILRGAALKRIEELRNEKKLGGSLEAEVDVWLDAASTARVAACRDELRFFFITSAVRVHDVANAPAEALVASFGANAARFIVTPTEAVKCVRCWHHRADVGSIAAHPELCGRCATNVAGEGERRDWF